MTHQTGIDYAALTGGGPERALSFGLRWSLRFYPRARVVDVARAIARRLVTSLLAATWPAVRAARLRALAGAEGGDRGARSKHATRSGVSGGTSADRTLVAAIAIGCALALFMESLNRGRDELVRPHRRVRRRRARPDRAGGWRERRDPRLRLANWRATLEAARALRAWRPSRRGPARRSLLAMGTHVVARRDGRRRPATEPRTYRCVSTCPDGRYLTPRDAGAVVIGQAIADRLVAGLDDEILATAVGQDGDIESALLRIVGIVRTGSDESTRRSARSCCRRRSGSPACPGRAR